MGKGRKLKRRKNTIKLEVYNSSIVKSFERPDQAIHAGLRLLRQLYEYDKRAYDKLQATEFYHFVIDECVYDGMTEKDAIDKWLPKLLDTLGAIDNRYNAPEATQ